MAVRNDIWCALSTAIDIHMHAYESIVP